MGGTGGDNIITNALYSIFELAFLSQAGFLSATFRANTVSWYLSAMIIVIAVYSPLLLKFRKTFLSLLAPLISLFIFGYVYSSYKEGFGGPSTFVNIMSKGLTRGFAEIALGCVCFSITQKLMGLKTTIFCKGLFSAFSIFCYMFVFYWSCFETKASFKTIMTLFIAIGVTISFSKQTLWNEKMNCSICYHLGEFSFNLYLSHGFWTHAMRKIWPVMSYWKLFVIYVIVVFCTAMTVHIISKNIVRRWPLLKASILSVLIIERGK